MDAVKAQELGKELLGGEVSGYTILDLINFGKSAAVFKAEREGIFYAVKIFDDELIEKYGNKAQLERIDRELSLKNNEHPNMVSIYSGGVDGTTNNHFLIMEYLPYQNLNDVLGEINDEDIFLYTQQIARAAHHLEDHGFVHRDIKPENILINLQEKKAVLMDLGVLRPIGGPGLTDADGILNFVGTLRYSPPEFLLREEEDTVEGWRSVTFYQIGAVMHDMIMRTPIFNESATPYAKLVNAVQEIKPEIQNANVDSYVLDLARSCLLKDPRERLRFVSWDLLEGVETRYSNDAKRKVTRRLELERADNWQTAEDKEDGFDASEAELVHRLREHVAHSAKAITSETDILPPIKARNVDDKTIELIINEEGTSSSFGVVNFLFEVGVSDTKDNLVFVSVYGDSFSSTEGNKKNVFSGVFNGQEIYEAVQQKIYEAIENELY